MIVDCLLPGVVRKLGANVTYLTPRKVAKVTVKECEVRGGEYVLFDRSDPATALKIWRPAAEQGDAVSQFRVGQIYEMGLNGTPDYQSAALWYRKAADQGNRTAAFNLAVLYEKGLGVTRDNAAALALYRKAQGLTDDDRRRPGRARTAGKPEAGAAAHQPARAGDHRAQDRRGRLPDPEGAGAARGPRQGRRAARQRQAGARSA